MMGQRLPFAARDGAEEGTTECGQSAARRATCEACALWGKKTKGEARSSALWGKPGAVRARACARRRSGRSRSYRRPRRPAPAARSASFRPIPRPAPHSGASGGKAFNVIVQAHRAEVDRRRRAGSKRRRRRRDLGKAKGLSTKFSRCQRRLAQLTGAADRRARAAAGHPGDHARRNARRQRQFSNNQRWPSCRRRQTSGRAGLSAATPTIAIVDSGIRPRAPTSAGASSPQVNLTSLSPNSPGDGRGHGTFVAGIAAGAPTATPAQPRRRRSSRSTSWTTRAWR